MANKVQSKRQSSVFINTNNLKLIGVNSNANGGQPKERKYSNKSNASYVSGESANSTVSLPQISIK